MRKKLTGPVGPLREIPIQVSRERIQHVPVSVCGNERDADDQSNGKTGSGR